MKAAKQTDPIDQKLAVLEEIHAYVSRNDKRIAGQVKGGKETKTEHPGIPNQGREVWAGDERR